MIASRLPGAPKPTGRAAVALALATAGVATMAPPLAAPQMSAPRATAQQRCTETALSSPDAAGPPTSAERALRFRDAWPLADGSGITIAVIDTGVADHPRLGEVADGGDVTGEAGAHHDCDAHGTLVAGLAAGRPGPDGFAGVAPGARILSIRQTTRDSGDLASLAVAVDRAVDEGARVINISLTSCAPPGTEPPGAEDIAAAVRRAEESGAVTVAAAGNSGSDCPDGAVAWPAVLDEVLAVSAVVPPSAPDDVNAGDGPGGGSPVDGHGGEAVAAGYAIVAEWVDVSAPGGAVLGPSPSGKGLVDLHVNSANATPIVGTSFAVPLVSGTAALVTSRYPHLSPEEVRRAIIATASPVPGTKGLGAGVVDPVAAVSWPGAPATGADSPVAPPAPRQRPATAPTRRVVALSLVIGAIAVAAGAWAAGRSRD